MLVNCTLQAGGLPLSLADLLDTFSERGFKFVYSSNVVDDSTVLDWPAAPMTIVELKDSLQDVGLTLESSAIKHGALFSFATPPAIPC
jgi:hypothetical protein